MGNIMKSIKEPLIDVIGFIIHAGSGIAEVK
jgi:hypothetical protein